MKKTFTMILFAAGTISVATAQSKRDVAYNDNKRLINERDEKHFAFDKDNTVSYNDYNFSLREKQAKIDKINREYDQKIAAVRYDRRLRDKKKTKQIDQLQRERQKEIDKVERDFAKSQRNQSHSRDKRW